MGLTHSSRTNLPSVIFMSEISSRPKSRGASCEGSAPPKCPNSGFENCVLMFPHHKILAAGEGLKRSGLNPLCSSHACLHTAFIAFSVPFVCNWPLAGERGGSLCGWKHNTLAPQKYHGTGLMVTLIRFLASTDRQTPQKRRTGPLHPPVARTTHRHAKRWQQTRAV